MECTIPVLTKACWKTSCKVRGNNAFGAQVVNRQTFFLGRHPTVPSMHLVLAAE